MCVQVLEEGSWSEGVESGLKSLGCHVVDAAALGSEASAPQACGCVFPATGCGMLSALRQGAGVTGTSRLSPAERDQLRAFLLQVRALSLICSHCFSRIRAEWGSDSLEEFDLKTVCRNARAFVSRIDLLKNVFVETVLREWEILMVTTPSFIC